MKPIPISIPLAFLIAAVACRTSAQITVWGDNTYGQKNVPSQATNVIALAAGDSHCLALRADGTVVAWGAAFAGQTNVPVDLTNAVGIAAGSTHSLALRSDGTIALWGRIQPSGITSAPSSATQVVALALGPGAQHALALRADGTVIDWGNSSYGLTNIPATAVDIVSVAAGSYHSLALRADGKVVTWGDNSHGQLNVPASATNIVAIATGWYGNAAVRADGALLVWGASTPPANYGFTNLVDVACPFNSIFGDIAPLALRRNGTLTQWQGTSIPAYPTNQIAAIGAGSYNALAAVATREPIFPGLPVNRTVPAGSRAYFRWNAVGQLPISYRWSCNDTNIPGATNSVLTLTNVQPELAGTYYTLTAANSLGTNASGAMFLQTIPSEVFVKVTNSSAVVGETLAFTTTVFGQAPFSYQWQFSGTNILSATNATLSLTNVLLPDAGLYLLIVSNSFGFVTNSVMLSVAPTIITALPVDQSSFPGGTVTFSLSLKTLLPIIYRWQFNGTDLPEMTTNSLTLTNIQYAQAGTYSLIFSNEFELETNSAVLTVSPVAGWGDNQFGQLRIPALTNVIAISSGGFHGLAVTSDGLVTSWGSNNFGQTNVPVGLTNVVAIAAGGFHSLALKRDGNVIAWGNNDSGQASPPPDLTNVIAIAAGDRHSLALRSNGDVVAWGKSDLGLTNVPADLTNAVAIAAGYAFNLVLRSDGSLVSWGANNLGQTNIPPELTNVVAISAGSFHSIAITGDRRIISWGDSGGGKTNVPAGLAASAVSGGWEDTMAITTNGTVAIWGYNSSNETNVPVGLSDVVEIAAGYYFDLALIKDGAAATDVLANTPLWTNNIFSIAVPSQSGRVYRQEFKGALSDTNWNGLPLVPGNGTIMTLYDNSATNRQRFYRISRW